MLTMPSRKPPKKAEARLLSLTQAPAGCKLRLHSLQAAPVFCQRLREMGFCESAAIVKVSSGKAALICQICNARVALSHEVARHILVEPWTGPNPVKPAAN
jgi:ferrous iron transport protein A